MTTTKTRNRLQRRFDGFHGGFTLLEILIVLAIILVIAAMVVPNLMGRQKQANIDVTMASVKNLEQAVKQYAAAHGGEYPSGGQDALEMLVQSTEYRGRTLQPFLEELPTDAWGEKLYYMYESDKFEHIDKPAIWSSGPDRTDDDGENDDINNWTPNIRGRL